MDLEKSKEREREREREREKSTHFVSVCDVVGVELTLRRDGHPADTALVAVPGEHVLSELVSQAAQEPFGHHVKKENVNL